MAQSSTVDWQIVLTERRMNKVAKRAYILFVNVGSFGLLFYSQILIHCIRLISSPALLYCSMWTFSKIAVYIKREKMCTSRIGKLSNYLQNVAIKTVNFVGCLAKLYSSLHCIFCSLGCSVFSRNMLKDTICVLSRLLLNTLLS